MASTYRAVEKVADPEGADGVSQEEEEEEPVRGYSVRKGVFAVALALALVLAAVFVFSASAQPTQVTRFDDKVELVADGAVKEVLEQPQGRDDQKSESEDVPELNMKDPEARTRQLIDIVDAKSPEEAQDMVNKAIKLAAQRAVAMHQKKDARKEQTNRKMAVIAAVPRITRTGRQVASAACVFDALGAADNIARVALIMQQTVITCPNSIGLRKNLCAIDAIMVIVFTMQVAQTLADAASDCAQSANFQALCAESVVGLVGALSQIAATSLIMKETCMPMKQFIAQNMANGGGLDLGSGLSGDDTGGPASLLPPVPPPSSPLDDNAVNGVADPTSADARRLFIGGGKANQDAQCYLDVADVAWSIAQVGISIFSSTTSCPIAKVGGKIPGVVGALATSMCTIDVSFILYMFAKIATFLDVAVIHCSGGLNLQAFCAAGVGGLIAALGVMPAVGAGLYATCHVGVPTLDMIDILFPGPAIKQGAAHSQSFWTGKGPAVPVRRLRESIEHDVGAGADEVKEKIWRQQGHNISYAEARAFMGLAPLPKSDTKDHVSIWRDLGYNITDANAPEWKALEERQGKKNAKEVEKKNDDLLNIMSPFLDMVGGTEEEKAEFQKRWPFSSKVADEL